MRIICIITVLLITTHLKAEEKFAINGEILTYRTDQNEDSEGIALDDVAVLKSLLKANNQVRVVKLSSSGGEVGAAYEIVDVVIERQLDTHVIDFCESACTLILLAGVNRTAEKNAKIGFHQTSISPADAKLEYTKCTNTNSQLALSSRNHSKLADCLFSTLQTVAGWTDAYKRYQHPNSHRLHHESIGMTPNHFLDFLLLSRVSNHDLVLTFKTYIVP